MEKQEVSETAARVSQAAAAVKKMASDISEAKRLRGIGCSNVFIAKRMEIHESTVRALLARGQA